MSCFVPRSSYSFKSDEGSDDSDWSGDERRMLMTGTSVNTSREVVMFIFLFSFVHYFI